LAIAALLLCLNGEALAVPFTIDAVDSQWVNWGPDDGDGDMNDAPAYVIRRTTTGY